MSNLPSNSELSRKVQAATSAMGVTARRHRRWLAVSALVEVFNIAVARGVIPRFLVKGGFALEFRFHAEARASRDIDFVIPIEANRILDAAIEVLRLNWSGFTFRIKGTPERREHSWRFDVNSLYQDREWSTFEVELVFDEIIADERVAPIDFTAYGLLQPSDIPCMTVTEQIAQKLHAVTDPGENRPRDLIDIYLFDTRLSPNDDDLRAECIRTFEQRRAHPWPPNIELRDGWDAQIEKLIADSDLTLSVKEVTDGVCRLIARLVGFIMAQNYRYHFLVLNGKSPVPNTLESAINNDAGHEILVRMTQKEGWRLAHMIPYPNGEGATTRSVLAVLEQPIEPADHSQ
jgi:hypothetical protein